MLRFGLAVFAATLASPAFACSIPVFRFALEEWQPSPYELLVYHRGLLAKEDQRALKQISELSRLANLKTTAIDLDQANAAQKAHWDREPKDVRTPRVVLRYPESGPEIPSVWSGPLDPKAVASLIDSPARRAILEKLTFGNAAVIVLLKSGDRAADTLARAMLDRELPGIAARIELPAPTVEGPQIRSVLPLRIAFPVVEVARDSGEELLVRMLVGSEDGLDQVRGPIAFPVFGRGRALCSLHGADLQKPGELRRSLEYLCRACSCGVKDLNPGVDLLIAGNWDSIFGAEQGPAPRLAPPDIQAKAETRPSESGGPGWSESRSAPPPGFLAAEVDGNPASTAGRGPWMRYGIAAALGLVLATGYWAMRTRRTGTPARV